MKANFLSRASIYQGDYNCMLRSPQNEMIAKLHYHDFYEIVIYLGSAGVFRINGNEYLIKRGDIALINMFDPHTLLYNNHIDYKRFSISIAPLLLLSYNTADSNLLDIFSCDNKHYPIFYVEGKCFDKYLQIIDLYLNHTPAHGKDIFEKALLHQIASYLYSDCYDGIHYDSTQARHVALVASLIDFINGHLDDDLSLSRLADKVNYSEYYICKIFKKITQYTLNSYIVEKRIEKAGYYINKDLPINQAAEKVGFHNYSYFYKAFRKQMGVNPNVYKEQHLHK